MPLSKAKDAARKKRERAKIRLDKQLLSSAGKEPIQPVGYIYIESPVIERPWEFVEIDADGNVIPDYD